MFSLFQSHTFRMVRFLKCLVCYVKEKKYQMYMFEGIKTLTFKNENYIKYPNSR